MLLYGDPQFEQETGGLLQKLNGLFALSESGDPSAARDLLIACGEFEQGLADANFESRDSARLTDLAADYFLALFYNRVPDDARSRFGAALGSFQNPPNRLRIKIPEGYAFYALYPEQYICSAEAWLKSNSAESVLVIGIRSIGTSLSALVHSVFKVRGRDSERITIRPTGHPYDRQTVLPTLSRKFNSVVIVDEGPGQSGSSIASAAQAAKEAGVSNVTFFPGHDHPPGAAASPVVRKLWSECPRCTTRLNEVRWNGLSLPEKLEAKSRELLNCASVAQMENPCAPGNRHNAGSADFLELRTPQFERASFLFKNDPGQGVHWKFSGLGPGMNFELPVKRNFSTQQWLFLRGFAPEPLLVMDGFIGMRWVDGEPLQADDLDATLNEFIADYIIAVAQPSSPSFVQEAASRLGEMVRVNFSEVFDSEIAAVAQASFQHLKNPGTLLYGDGRLSPHKWIKTGAGQIVKIDCWGHDFDHTCIGPQSILWDVAAALIEWRMSDEQREHLLRSLARGGIDFAPADVRPYLLAYIAFRFAVLKFSTSENSKVQGWLKHLALEILNLESGALDGRAGDRNGADQDERKKNGVGLKREVVLGVK